MLGALGSSFASPSTPSQVTPGPFHVVYFQDYETGYGVRWSEDGSRVGICLVTPEWPYDLGYETKTPSTGTQKLDAQETRCDSVKVNELFSEESPLWDAISSSRELSEILGVYPDPKLRDSDLKDLRTQYAQSRAQLEENQRKISPKVKHTDAYLQALKSSGGQAPTEKESDRAYEILGPLDAERLTLEEKVSKLEIQIRELEETLAATQLQIRQDFELTREHTEPSLVHFIGIEKGTLPVTTRTWVVAAWWSTQARKEKIHLERKIQEASASFRSCVNFDPKTGTILGFHRTQECLKIRNLEIPSKINGVAVRVIGEVVFTNLSLTSLVIPSSVTSIGEWAFYNNKLTSLVIPNSVTSIGDGAFYNNNLTSLVIPNSVTSIGGRAFKANALTSLVIPNSVTSIGDYAFYQNQLTSVVIPNSVTSIGQGAFVNNPLRTVELYKKTTLGKDAFPSETEMVLR
jgi:hypothetical protein